MRKRTLSFLLLFSLCATLSSCKTSEYEIKSSLDTTPIDAASYTVECVDEGETSHLGKYHLSFLNDGDTYYITETKDYLTEMADGTNQILNTKQYTYDFNKQLVGYLLDEKRGEETTYYASYLISEKDENVRVLESDVNGHHNEKFFPNNDIRISSGSSDIFIKTFGDLPDPGEIWFSYDLSGYLDVFECISIEDINSEVLGNIICKKIYQNGMFDTYYWIAENGLIIRIEQIMDDDYSVIIELESYS